MPVPILEAGHLLEGLELDDDHSGLEYTRSRGDRELGGIAQYELRATRNLAETMTELGEDPPPFLQWVTQVIVLLTDGGAAARWFEAKLGRFESYEGNEVDGFFYRQVVAEPIPAFGDEAAVTVAHTEIDGISFVDTHIAVRRGRLLGFVSASTYKDFEIGGELLELARRLLPRMEALLAEDYGPSNVTSSF